MLLVTPLSAVILCSAMERWFLSWHSWMSTQSFQCWGMLHGHCQTSAGASHSLRLSRFLSYFIGFLSMDVVKVEDFLTCEICWAGETSPSCTWTSCSFNWWRSPNWCLLGTLLSFWWYKWQNPSCYWGRGLSSTCGAPPVSSDWSV